MFIEVRPDINVGLLDCVEDQLRHAGTLPAQEVGLEESLASRESLVIDLEAECKCFSSLITVLP